MAGGRDKNGDVLADLYLIDAYAPVPFVTKLSSNLTASRYKTHRDPALGASRRLLDRKNQ